MKFLIVGIIDTPHQAHEIENISKVFVTRNRIIQISELSKVKK